MAEFPYSELTETDDIEMSMILCLKAIYDLLEETKEILEESRRYLKNII